jgi:hypothetical protein
LYWRDVVLKKANKYGDIPLMLAFRNGKLDVFVSSTK